ncbi:MAG: cytochrome P450 [Sphingomonas sp.]
MLHDRLIELLFDTVCDWIGIPPRRRDAERQVQAMAWMIAQAGSIGPRTARALWRRRGSERWARRLIAEVRSGELPVDASTPLARLAAHRDPNGRALDLVAAGVELINIIRPTVAVARFITFAALAMHEHPGACDRLEDPAYRRAFAQEVRRFYPFFPVIGGRVLDGFVWQQRIFRRGEWVLLGLYATNHDPAIWGDPEVFRPARFLRSDPGAFRLVPQGAGDHHDDHRCPGEWLTLGLIDRAIVLLRNAMRYIVPPQDLAVPRDRFPTLPNSGLVLADVRAR